VTFDPALTTPTDRIRFSVQDVDDAAPMLPEATYTALYARYDDSEDRATVAAAEALLVKYAQHPDSVEITGAVKVAWKYRLAAWRELANSLRIALGLPVQGGTDSTLYVGQFVRTAGSGSEFGG
jgi:hypothetical protein